MNRKLDRRATSSPPSPIRPSTSPEDPKLTNTQKMAQLDRLEPQVDAALREVESLEAVEAKHKAFHAATGMSLADLTGTTRPRSVPVVDVLAPRRR